MGKIAYRGTARQEATGAGKGLEIPLILCTSWRILTPAMMRILILLIGLLWASLLLLSWGGRSEAQLTPAPAIDAGSAVS